MVAIVHNAIIVRVFGTHSLKSLLVLRLFFYDRCLFRLAYLSAAFAGVSHLRMLEIACVTFSRVIFVVHSLACIIYCAH